MKPRTIVFLGLAVLSGIVLTMVGSRLFFRPYTYQGSLLEPPVSAADFTLTDQDGAPFSLSQLKGKVVILFFGYTFCPDVCPATFTEFKNIFQNLGEKQDQAAFVFVTVDPDRDSPEQIKNHLANFNPDFIGLTGETEKLAKVWEDYGVYQEKQDTGNPSGYLVDHSAFVYVLDQDGNLRLLFPFGMDEEAMLEDIIHVMQGG